MRSTFFLLLVVVGIHKCTENLGIRGIDIPTPSQYCIMVGTESATSMDDADYKVVAKHLGHSTATQRCHYEAATCDGALKAYKKLDELEYSQMKT